MKEYTRQELNIVRQIFKHDNHMIFRIYTSVYPIPKHLPYYHHSSIYELKVQTVPPYSCYINHFHIRDFLRKENAWSISQERVNTISRQFGFDRYSIGHWFKGREE